MSTVRRGGLADRPRWPNRRPTRRPIGSTRGNSNQARRPSPPSLPTSCAPSPWWPPVSCSSMSSLPIQPPSTAVTGSTSHPCSVGSDPSWPAPTWPSATLRPRCRPTTRSSSSTRCSWCHSSSRRPSAVPATTDARWPPTTSSTTGKVEWSPPWAIWPPPGWRPAGRPPTRPGWDQPGSARVGSRWPTCPTPTP